MPKTYATPRSELICGKLGKALEIARGFHCVPLVELLQEIWHDAERMEAKLIIRKDEVEALTAQLTTATESRE